MNDQSGKTIMITGASGFIGHQLVKFFLEKGASVRALQRRIRGSDPAKPGLEYIEYDFRKGIYDAAFRDAHYLIHCAHQHYDVWNRDADELNLQAAHDLVSKCREQNVRIIFLSTLSAHEEAESHYGKTKLLLERVFDPRQDLILRPGLVIGMGGLFGRIYGAIKRQSIIPLIGSGKQPVQTIALDDLCAIIEIAIRKDIKGKYDVAEPIPLTIKEMHRIIARAIGKWIVLVPLPFTIAMGAARIAEFLKIRIPVSSESLLGLRRLKVFETKQDLSVFDVKVKTFKETINTLVS